MVRRVQFCRLCRGARGKSRVSAVLRLNQTPTPATVDSATPPRPDLRLTALTFFKNQCNYPPGSGPAAKNH